jgi:hypothetical protein
MTALLDTLKKSLNERRHQLTQAEKDLNAAVFELRAAVHEVSSGQITVELSQLKSFPSQGPTYGLKIYSDRTKSEDDLGVYVLSVLGYPIAIYNNVAHWQKSYPGEIFNIKLIDSLAVQNQLSILVDGPDSLLVRWIATDMARTVD